MRRVAQEGARGTWHRALSWFVAQEGFIAHGGVLLRCGSDKPQIVHSVSTNIASHRPPNGRLRWSTGLR